LCTYEFFPGGHGRTPAKVQSNLKFCVLGEEDLTDTDSVMTGADSPELAESIPDKENMRWVNYPYNDVL